MVQFVSSFESQRSLAFLAWYSRAGRLEDWTVGDVKPQVLNRFSRVQSRRIMHHGTYVLVSLALELVRLFTLLCTSCIY